jgi:hypothetical protein
VNAKNKGDAIEMLDECGNAEQAILSPLTDRMSDVRLCDDGRIELEDIGESTHDCIFASLLPGTQQCLRHSRVDETGQDYSEKGRNQIREPLSWSELDYRVPSRQ